MTCGYNLTRTGEYISDIKSTSYPNDFSSWNGFGKLWEWAQKQDWWVYFVDDYQTQKYGLLNIENYLHSIINPDRFANTVYNYLKEQQQ